MESTQHSCETCGHIFESDDELKEHMLSAHGEDIEAESQDDKEANAA